MGQMPQVHILGIVGFPVDLEGNVVRFSVVDFFISGFDRPFPPGSNDLHGRCQRLDRQLKPYLVVALAGAAVADGVSAFSLGNFDDPFCDNRSCKRGAQQVFVLINSASFEGGEDIVFNKLFLDILNVQLGSASLFGSFLETFQLSVLAGRYRIHR